MRHFLVRGALLCAALAASAAQGQPTPPNPPAAARLETDHLPPAPQADTLLHVTAPGRFAITAKSPSGAALDLVDMITGPSARAGNPGSQDGRLDVLLDTGTYKLRSFSAPGATGSVALQVAAFHEAGPVGVVQRNAETDTALSDLQQRSWWFVVTPDHPVRLEAAGRALSDLRLWRDGLDLVATNPDTQIIEPVHGHPMRDILFTDPLPPGTYLATAYGGPALPWADGDAASPLILRDGASDALRLGWLAGKIGPLGHERFTVDGDFNVFRLTMAGPAVLSVDGSEVVIDKRSRLPQASLFTATSGTDHLVEVRGPAGASFQLQATMLSAQSRIGEPGRYWVTATTDGLGGDEVPATLVLARRVGAGFIVLGSNAPDIGPGVAWRRRFNLAGQVSVLFHLREGGRVAITSNGKPVRVGGMMALDDERMVPQVPPLALQSPALWDLAAGWYELYLAPPGAAGVADVTIGPPGVAAPLGAPGADSPVVTFGEQSVAWSRDGLEFLQLFGNAAPHGRFGLEARRLPLDLRPAQAAGNAMPAYLQRAPAGYLTTRPLAVSQNAGETLDVPVLPGEGTLTALEVGHGPIEASYLPDRSVIELPAADHARVVMLSWPAPPPPAPPPVPVPEDARPVLEAGTPYFLDLAEGEPRSVDLHVAQGGLFRVETTGRLRTSGAIGTHFVPDLARADANGIGQNMRLQGFLRAGRYHVDTTAEASAGHAGLVAVPAPLRTSPALLPGGTVRASLVGGSGLLVPVSIAAAGTYRLELLGLHHAFTARLEDAQGWPLAASAPLASMTQDLAAGQYRLLVSPEPVDARAVIRLTRIEPSPALTGHGPHALPFDAPQQLTWREPAGRNDTRVPDTWRFTLAAPADITLAVTDGMEAVLRRADGSQVAHLVGDAPFSGRVPEGAYEVQAVSQGRNDRLDYTISLGSAQLQPGAPRGVSLPSRVSFNVARDQVVSLTSFGGLPVRAVLRDGADHVVGRFGAREDDWNIAISRPLAAGSYTLDVDNAAPPVEQPTPVNANDRAGPAAPPEDDQSEGDGEAAPEPAQSMAPQPQRRWDFRHHRWVTAYDDASEGEGSTDQGQTEVTLALPAEAPPVVMGAGGVTLQGGGVHRLTLPQPNEGTLIVAGAASAAALVLSLEQLQDGAWQSRALSQGLAPLVALPVGAARTPWRVSVWPVDGGALPMQAAVRLLDQPALPGPPRLVPAALPGVAGRLAVAHVALPSRDVVRLVGRSAGVLAGGWPDHAASVPDAGLIAPQTGALWLVAPRPGPLGLVPLPPGATLTMTLPEGGAHAVLPAQLAPLVAWIAESPGQPGLGGGHGMGVAEGSAFALSEQQPATVWNAGAEDALRVQVHPVPLTLLRGDGSAPVPPFSAMVVSLPAGAVHRLRLDLPPGTAAVAGWPDPDAAAVYAAGNWPAVDAVTVWAGRQAVSHTMAGGWSQLLLVNTTAAAAPIALAVEDVAAAEALAPDRAVKRFFGAAGALDLAASASAGQMLVVAGDATAVAIGADGRVRRGTRLVLGGPSRVTLQHGVGLVAAWLEGGDATPWPVAAPAKVTLPAAVTLSGAAMVLDLAQGPAGLLRLASSGPVILAINDGAPRLFAAGVAESVYLPAGPALLTVISPQDGPLSGTLALSLVPVRAAQEGVGAAAAVAPGDAVLFGFTLKMASRIGIGVRAEPDVAGLTLLDANGQTVAAGAAMLRDLPAGSYVLQASVPQDAPTTLLRPAIVGLVPRPNGPPPDVIAMYRALAGLVQKDVAR
jgi:hypothetical protein